MGLIGAVIGGILTLAGTLLLELRRERRLQFAGARLISAELRRSAVEFAVRADDPDAGWFEGPHHPIRTTAWQEYAPYLVRRLPGDDFEHLDHLHAELATAAEFGFTASSAKRLADELEDALTTLAPYERPPARKLGLWRL